jgi:hypothetical protein
MEIINAFKFSSSALMFNSKKHNNNFFLLKILLPLNLKNEIFHVHLDLNLRHSVTQIIIISTEFVVQNIRLNILW